MRQQFAFGLNVTDIPTSCEGSLDFIPGIAGPAESSFALGKETIKQQVMLLLKPLANQRQHDPLAVSTSPC